MNASINSRFSFFLLGMLLGGTIINILIGEQVDNLSTANQSLRNELSIRETELQELKVVINERKKQIVTGIQPHVTFPTDDINKHEEQLLRMEVENFIRKLLEDLQGEEVQDINYIMLLEIIDEREFEFENRKYNLKVNTVVITDKIIVFVDALPAKKDTY